MIMLERNRLELMVDRYLIERMAGTELRLQAPVSAGRALTFDRPWEGGGSFYVTVLKDGRHYRMYYRGWPDSVNDMSPVKGAFVCYAESLDGIHWVRPCLGLHEINGSCDNNVLLTGNEGTHAFGVFLDSNPEAREDERYKAFGLVHAMVGGLEREVLAGFVSPDGIQWRRIREEPILTKGAFDSLNVGFWSEHERCYVAYYRSWTESTESTVYAGKRAVSRATSADFIHWSDPVLMDCGDVPAEEFYTNGTHPYFRAPHIYIAIPKRFRPDRRALTDEQASALGVHPTQVQGMSDGVLMTSRGGNRYDRTFMEAFIRPGADLGNWSARNNHAATGVVPTGPNEMSMYVVRHYAQPTTFIERMTLRTDGFASLHAGYAGGEMLTKPMVIHGEGLGLNMATSAVGTVRVEVLEPDGKPLAGLSLDDCEPMIGDQLDYRVRWKGGSSLADVGGRTVRLRFVLNDADIYAFRVE